MKETDLRGVKEIAKIFLAMKPMTTEMSPAIVQHPFTNTGYFPYRTVDGNLRIINIMTPQGFNEWKEIMSEKIDRMTSVAQIFLYVNKPYSMTFLKYVKQYLSEQDFAETLAECWVREEQPNMNPNFTKAELTGMFKRADKKHLMSETGYRKWKEMPERVTVYRGVTGYNGKNIRALSWTMSCKTAKWFAGRFKEQGKIYQAEIDKKHILAYIDQRGESELIVDPKYLKNVEMVEDLSMNMTMRI